MTGASGFLGKKLLARLTADSRIERIDVISRKKRTYPDARVRMHQMDLVQPWATPELLDDVDTIIHLAGLYDFAEPFSQCYQQNVLPILNLIDCIRERRSSNPPQIHMASTYAVGFGSSEVLEEKPLKHFPPTGQAYAYTKAIAERALTDSGLPARIFRLGVLVGDSEKGEIEKIDGPYYLMSFLHKLGKNSWARKLKKFPFPYNPNGLTPLVPVDCAAEIFQRALFLPNLEKGQQEYYGLFSTESIQTDLLARNIFRQYLPDCEPRALQFGVNTKNRIAATTGHLLTELQSRFTTVPPEAIGFACMPVALSNPNFQAVFGAESVPAFHQYRETFFKGFQKCMNLN